MPKNRLALALTTLAIIALVGLLANTAHAATAYCYTAQAGLPTGHFDWYQGQNSTTESIVWRTPTITRGFYYWRPPFDPPLYDTSRAYPRKNGYCAFNIPGFNWTGDLPACTLFYYQSAHNGTPDLLVNAWLPFGINTNPPADGAADSCFWRIWRSTDTVAWDSTRAVDGNWYKVPLSYWGTCAVADSGSKYYAVGGSALFYTGWKYPSYAANHGQTGWYTDVSGDNAPYIKVVYTPGP
jgi:hypothetical protein